MSANDRYLNRFDKIIIFWFQRRLLKDVCYIWAWQPIWSRDLNHTVFNLVYNLDHIFGLPHIMEDLCRLYVYLAL